MIQPSSSVDILAQEAADLIALGALNWRAEPRVPRPRDKVSYYDFLTNARHLSSVVIGLLSTPLLRLLVKIISQISRVTHFLRVSTYF